MLGFMTTDAEVGYYGAAIKIKSILASTISALGTVLLPRLSNYYLNGRETEFYGLLKKDSQFISVAAFGLVTFSVVAAEPIILLLSGDTYRTAIPVMQVVMLAVVFIGFSTMLGNNVLVPQKRERVTIEATLVGFVALIILNALLIPRFGALGSAVATVVGEAAIVCFELIYLRRELGKMFSVRSVIVSAVSAAVALVALVVVGIAAGPYLSNTISELIVSALVFFITYVGCLVILKEEFTMSILNNMFARFLNRVG